VPSVIGLKYGTCQGDHTLEQKQGLYFTAKTLSRTYYVLGDNLDDTEDDILATTGIPPILYPMNGAWVKKRSAKETDRVIHPETGTATGLWEVVIDLDSTIDGENQEEDQEPEARRPQVNWDFETEDEVLEKDVITGEPIQTEAGEQILATHPIVFPILEITRYELAPFDPTVNFNYANRLNSGEFWGAPAEHALMLPVVASEEVIEGSLYARVTYRIKFAMHRPDIEKPFQLRPLHAGSLYRTLGETLPILYRDKQGNAIKVNLTAGGFLLANESPPEYLAFNRCTLIDFNTLSIGPF
jgi:hypothetical protein